LGGDGALTNIELLPISIELNGSLSLEGLALLAMLWWTAQVRSGNRETVIQINVPCGEVGPEKPPARTLARPEPAARSSLARPEPTATCSPAHSLGRPERKLPATPITRKART
jgi:hypothetical protein